MIIKIVYSIMEKSWNFIFHFLKEPCTNIKLMFYFLPDVITIEKTGEHFRLLYDVKGRFTIHRIKPEEAKVRHTRVFGDDESSVPGRQKYGQDA